MLGKHSKLRIFSSTLRPSESAATAECRSLFSSLLECSDVRVQEKFGADVTRHLGECNACQEFVLSLRDTILRIAKQSSGELGPADAAHIGQVVLAQYVSAMTTAARDKSAH
jgi:hypothetical protein